MPIWPLAVSQITLQMTHARPTETTPVKEIPVEYIEEAAGLYFRSILLKEKNTFVPQHEHDHRHATLVCAGKARGWCGEVWIGDKGPGEAFDIEPGSSHSFMALEPDTRLACVHDIASAESVKAKGL